MANVEHSVLSGASLHSSKVETFTGDPAAYTPSQSGIYVVRTDVTPNKLYRTTGTTAGAVTEVGSATAGTAATITVGTVGTSTLAAGESAAVALSNSGTSAAFVLDAEFDIPTGPAGDDGRTILNGTGAPAGGLGADGDFYIDTAADEIYGPKASGAWGAGRTLGGADGAAATIAVGTTSTLAAGASATVANSGTSSAAVFDFGIPQGAAGDGFTGGSYNASTGVVTFASDDGLGFATGDLRGADGVDGFGLLYTYDGATTAGALAGELRLNNAAIGSVTAFYVSETDANSVDVSTVLDQIQSGAVLFFRSRDTANEYAFFQVAGAPTDNGTDRTIPVTYLAHTGTFADPENLLLSPVLKGDTGATGAVTAASALTLTEQAGITSTGANEIDLVNVGNELQWRLESDGATYTAAATNRAQTYTAAQRGGTVTLTDGPNIPVDASLGNVFEVLLGGNRTLDNPTNLVDGQTLIFRVIQDGTGGRTLSYGTAYRFPGGVAPTLSTAANSVDYLSGVTDGTNVDLVASLAFA